MLDLVPDAADRIKMYTLDGSIVELLDLLSSFRLWGPERWIAHGVTLRPSSRLRWSCSGPPS